MSATRFPFRRLGLLALASMCLLSGAQANEAAIRKNIAERFPTFPKIDEVSKTPIPGLYEIRVGTDIMYADEEGHHLIEGQILDTRTKTNLTEARVNKLTEIDFASLALKDAIVVKRGTGARKVVIFSDPNCGYCKRLERDLQQVKDVTIYTFLYPILGPDSVDKSKNIWCAKDNSKAYLDWMLSGAAAPKSMGACDASALQRNAAFGAKHKVQATPVLVFEDGKRSSGALSTEQIEKQLASSRKSG